MDKGGSLAVNLNNLYLLCTARLLRANLKMDMDSLNSVESILSGLRGAYAQIIETPEARQASNDIATRLQPMGTMTRSAQPIIPSTVTAVPRSHAQAAYGRSAMRPAAPVAEAPSQTADAQRAHVQSFDQAATQAVGAQPRLPGAYGKP